MSSTTTITTAPQQHGFRLSPAPSNRSQPRQIPHPHPQYQHTRTVFSREGRLGSQHDMSSAAYYGQRSLGYEAGAPDRDSYNYSAPLPRSWASARETQNWSEGYQTHSQPQVSQRQQYRPPQQGPAQVRQSASTTAYASRQPAARPTSPASAQSSHIPSGASANGDAQSMVMHSLQIPARISSKGGNLADFSAQLTCLFWFESPKVLEAAEKIRSVAENRPLPSLSAHALPTEPFRKWVSSVLSTTQVTQNVILLALLFVYRLKMTNPSVRGRPGSEYRLLTVALMLGNKFLDDNTYTNKTWAEVSGISVQDIHVMEVEFLSNMRYALLASSEQWEEWLDKLASYYVFCERVSNGPSSSSRMVPSPTLLIPSPTAGKGVSPVASPIAYQSAQRGFAVTSGGRTYSPPALPANPVPMMYPETVGSVATGGLNNRKRSWDEQSAEPPAKRAYLAPAQQTLKPAPDARRLPVPGLTLNTNYQAPVTQPTYASTSYSMQQQQQQQGAPYAVSLPPLEPETRAMSTVYAPPTTTSWPPASTVTSSGAAQQNLHHAKVVTPTNQYPPTVHYPPTSNATFSTPTKRLSPINNSLTPVAAYNASSPLHEYPHNSGFHTPITHSPSIYLQQRNSPYKPIRHVRTLLNPPPPLSLQSYQLPAIPPSQMHYQPIGRRNDQRTGIVPEYRVQDAYGRHSGFTPGQPATNQQGQHRFTDLMH